MRQPYTVLVFPFRLTAAGAEFAIFRRSDDSNWQCVSGGVEGDETMSQAARRETAEETGLSNDRLMFKLNMVSGVEKNCFAASSHWPADLYIVPKHFYATRVVEEDSEIQLSDEHREFRWMSYDEAYATLCYDDDRTALWELNTRIVRGDMPVPEE